MDQNEVASAIISFARAHNGSVIQDGEPLGLSYDQQVHDASIDYPMGSFTAGPGDFPIEMTFVTGDFDGITSAFRNALSELGYNAKSETVQIGKGKERLAEGVFAAVTNNPLTKSPNLTLTVLNAPTEPNF